MLDDTMGPLVLLKSGGTLYSSSIDINVSFLAAAKPGPLICEAEVLRLGKTVGFVEGRLMDSEGRMLARATSSVMLVPAERASQLTRPVTSHHPNPTGSFNPTRVAGSCLDVIARHSA
jgi:hypothetical protein